MVARASRFLTAEEKQAVQDAVAAAERNTAGEIVVVLATRSGRYDRAEDLVGVLVACVSVAAGWWLFQGAREGDWGSAVTVSLGLLPVLGLLVGGFALGAFLATRVPALARLFINKREMLDEIHNKAAAAFQRFRVRSTAAGSGVLLYVSLFEHMVWVVGDAPINDKVPQSEWEQIRDRILGGFRRGDRAGGLCAAVARCSEILAEHFPPRPDDVDELTNELRILD